MKCPACPEVALVMSERQGIEIDYCPNCRGVWLDRGELDKIIERSAADAPQTPVGQAPPQPSPSYAPPSYAPPPQPAPGYAPPQQGYRTQDHGYGGHGHHGHKRRKHWLEDIFD